MNETAVPRRSIRARLGLHRLLDSGGNVLGRCALLLRLHSFLNGRIHGRLDICGGGSLRFTAGAGYRQTSQDH